MVLAPVAHRVEYIGSVARSGRLVSYRPTTAWSKSGCNGYSNHGYASKHNFMNTEMCIDSIYISFDWIYTHYL